jgi:hypothetical protein
MGSSSIRVGEKSCCGGERSSAKISFSNFLGRRPLTKGDADYEVAVRRRLIGIIKLQQEPCNGLIRHVQDDAISYERKEGINPRMGSGWTKGV